MAEKDSMNREQRREFMHSHGDRRMVLKRILLTFEDGRQTELDTSKVMIVDRQTKKPLFDEVIEEL